MDNEFKSYRILINTEEDTLKCLGHIHITEEGALIIWSAYEKLYGKNCQSMETREGRGGICWLSEIDYWKGKNALPMDFNYKDYEIKE